MWGKSVSRMASWQKPGRGPWELVSASRGPELRVSLTGAVPPEGGIGDESYVSCAPSN